MNDEDKKLDPVTEEIGKLMREQMNPRRLFAILWRKLLLAADMDEVRWNELMSIYIPRPGLTRKQETDACYALTKSLAGQEFTLGIFMKGLRLLRVSRFTMTLSVEFNDKPSVTVSHLFDMKDAVPEK